MDYICVYPFIPFPGCEIFNNPHKYGIVIETYDWSKYLEPNVVFRNEFLSSREIKTLFHASRAFALEKSKNSVMEMSSSFEERRTLIKNYLLAKTNEGDGNE